MLYNTSERIITPPRKFNPNSEPRDKDCDCSHVDSQTTVEVVYLLIKNKPLRESVQLHINALGTGVTDDLEGHSNQSDPDRLEVLSVSLAL